VKNFSQSNIPAVSEQLVSSLLHRHTVPFLILSSNPILTIGSRFITKKGNINKIIQSGTVRKLRRVVKFGKSRFREEANLNASLSDYQRIRNDVLLPQLCGRMRNEVILVLNLEVDKEREVVEGNDPCSGPLQLWVISLVP
jgi:hypothetical protein